MKAKEWSRRINKAYQSMLAGDDATWQSLCAELEALSTSPEPLEPAPEPEAPQMLPAGFDEQ